MNKGVTLIEVVIVLAIMGIVFSLGVPLTINHYQSYLLISERDNILGFLRRARTLALANRNSLSHGVYIESSQYSIFEGQNFLNRNSSLDEVFPKSQSVSIAGSSEIIFAPLSATTAPVTLTLSNNNQNISIQINAEGGILW